MIIKPGSLIKLKKKTNCIKPKKAVIPQYEVLTVLEQNESNNTLLVKDIADSIYTISGDSVFKIIGKDKNFNPKEVKAAPHVIPLKDGGKLTVNKVDPIAVRAVQKMQTVVSNIHSTEDVIASNMLLMAGICGIMSVIPNMERTQSSRLLTMMNKLLGKANN